MTYILMTLDDLESYWARFSTEKLPYLKNVERFGVGYYEGRSINKLQNSSILLVFQITKILMYVL